MALVAIVPKERAEAAKCRSVLIRETVREMLAGVDVDLQTLADVLGK